MVISRIMNKGEQKQNQIDIREAYSLWDVLNSKYLVMDKMMLYENFVHDPDLKLVIQVLYKPLQKNINILEKEMEKYAIKSPDRNRAAAISPENPKTITDEEIATDIFIYFQEHIENLLRVFGSSVTNESVRKMFKEMTKRTVEETNTMIYYLRTKGWLSVPPIYKNVPTSVTEDLSMCEAANLWDHLAYRYDSLHTTEIFVTIVHDKDFKLILELGLRQLKKQIGMLEKEVKYFGLPFPKRPGKVTLLHKDMQIFDDEYIYRSLHGFMQGAFMKHAQSFKECTVNDKIRGIFKKLLYDEIDIIDNYIKFGKLKGWLNAMPTYGS